MAVNEFRYSPLPEEREASNNLQLERNYIPKWVEHSVKHFGTEDVKFDDREDWAVILADFEITWVMLIIMLVYPLLGLVYLFLRLQGYLSPFKDYTERSYQKLIRWILTLLMLLLIAAILYFVISALLSSLALRRIQDQQEKENNNATSRKLDHVFIYNYEEFRNKTERSANELVGDWLKTHHSEAATALACPPAIDVENITWTIEHINKEFDLLCLEVLEWSDYMRFFYRNLSTNLLQMDFGEILLKRLDFSNFLTRTLQVDALLNFHHMFGFMERFFNSFSLLYNTSTQLPEALENRVRNALSPYFLGIEKDLKEKGQQFRSLSTKLWQERAADSLGQSRENWRPKKPLWVYIWEWICYVFLLLIKIILLIAFLFRCFGKRYRIEAKCCNHENGSILFQSAALLIFIFFLLVLLPFLWHFVHGVGLYNGVCRKLEANRERRSINLKTRSSARDNDNCLNKYSFHNFLATDDVRPNFTLLLPADLKLVARPLRNMSEWRKYAIDFKQNAKDAKDLNLTNLCDGIISDMDAKYFIEMHKEIFKFVNGDIANNPTKDLSLCNLDTFKTYRIDQLETSTIYKSAEQIAEDCAKVVSFFTQSYTQITTKCIESIEGVRKYYSKENKLNLSAIVDSLNQMYADELTDYADMASHALADKVGVCRSGADMTDDQMECYGNAQLLNTIWSALMILIWLLLPLIPIALYLARLYGTTRPFKKCSCVNGKTRVRQQGNCRKQRIVVQEVDALSRQYKPEHCATNGQPICRTERTHENRACGQKQRQNNAAKSCGETSAPQKCIANTSNPLRDCGAESAMVHQANTRLYKEEVQDVHKPSTSKGVCRAKKECASNSAPPENITEKRYSKIVGEIRSIPKKVKTTACNREASTSGQLCSVTAKPRERNTIECDNKRFEETNRVTPTVPNSCEDKFSMRVGKGEEVIKDATCGPSTSTKQTTNNRQWKSSDRKELVEERRERLVKTTTSLHLIKIIKK